MSIRKNKVFQGFRLDPDVLDKIKQKIQEDPVTFSSQARLVDAALYHFLKLSKSEQKQIIKDYLTKDL